ncbi:hypothetical protein VTO73DRAFT_11556 [Trametes versicolor]
MRNVVKIRPECHAVAEPSTLSYGVATLTRLEHLCNGIAHAAVRHIRRAARPDGHSSRLPGPGRHPLSDILDHLPSARIRSSSHRLAVSPAAARSSSVCRRHRPYLPADSIGGLRHTLDASALRRHVRPVIPFRMSSTANRSCDLVATSSRILRARPPSNKRRRRTAGHGPARPLCSCTLRSIGEGRTNA